MQEGRPRNPDDYRHLADRPEISDRKRIIDIIASAFFVAQIVVAGLAGAGLFVPVLAEDRPPLWIVLVVVALTDAPVVFIVASRLASQSTGKGFREAAAAAVPIVVLPLAWCMTTTILGLVSPFLGASPAVVWGFIGCGLALHWPVYSIYRGKAVDLMLVELGWEEDQRRRA